MDITCNFIKTRELFMMRYRSCTRRRPGITKSPQFFLKNRWIVVHCYTFLLSSNTFYSIESKKICFICLQSHAKHKYKCILHFGKRILSKIFSENVYLLKCKCTYIYVFLNSLRAYKKNFA